MRRYGWDYDREYRGRGARPRGFYDRGYRDGWGMTGLNNAFLHGLRPEERGYDHAIHGRRSGGAYDRDFFRPRGWGERSGPYFIGPRGGYDRGWF